MVALSFSFTLWLCFALTGPVVWAAGRPALAQQVKALDDTAAAAYKEGDFDKMKKQLLKAVSLGTEALGSDPVLARVYLHLGVLYVDGLDDRDVAIKYFTKALKIQPDAQVQSNMATKAVMNAFAEASRHESAASQPARATPAPAPSTGGGGRCHGDAELTDVKRQARQEFDRLEKALSMAKDALTKERADSERFRKDKMDLERALAEAKQRVTQLENDARQKERLAAASQQREKKAHDATEALEKEKVEKDSLILDTAQRLQELERETAEKDKRLAAAAQREEKERKAREKVEHERDVIEAREHERKAWEERARAERDKLEAGPPLPSRIPEPLHCAVPEEVQGGADLFVQCVAQPAIRAKTIVFYYRPPSSSVYNAVVMDPTKRGWSRAVITANKLNGKLLQYYAEVRDGKDSVAATNGKASSPNVVTIVPR